MISGNSRRYNPLAFAAALFIAFILTALPAQAGHDGDNNPAWDIDKLMSLRQSVTSATAHFTERRYMQVLREPLVVSGTLHYTAPDILSKETIKPNHERFTVEGNTLTIEVGKDGQTQTLTLPDHPEIWAYTETIRAVLSGDLTALQRYYSLSMDGTASAWRLLLLPELRSMQNQIKWIRISGSEAEIHSIDTQERNGDRFEMTVTKDAP